MPKKKKRSTDGSYMRGLLFDPFIRGKWKIHSSSCHAQPRKGLFISASMFWLLSTISVLTFLGSIVFFLLHPREEFSKLFLASSFAGFCLSSLVSYLSRLGCTCPLCRGTSLINGRNKKNKDASKIKPLGFAGTAMLSILLRRKYRCSHCGTPFDLNKKR